jgi:phosphoribosylaminoimidazolecarboxamide formyltransferase / IMP cyclohydrolase
MGIRRVEKIEGLVPVRRAIISVSDKTDLETLVPGLIRVNPDIIIYSTGGTFSAIKKIIGDEVAGRNLLEASTYTGMPETEGGLVKILHHRVFLGTLTESYCEGHQRDLEREEAVEINLLVVNPYPFQKIVEAADCDIEDARGNIDIGGPSNLRAAAKNWHRVMTVVDPRDYGKLLDELDSNDGCTTLRTRYDLHWKVFALTAAYDQAIVDFGAGVPFEDAVKSYEVVDRVETES